MQNIHHFNENNEFDLSVALCNICITEKMDLKIKSKFWLEVDDMCVFGSGKKSLLEAIEKHGSINKAAKEMSISYRKAWSQIDAMEKRLGIKLVERKTGGKGGGGAILTQEARAILEKYREFEKGLQELVDRRFMEIFKKRLL